MKKQIKFAIVAVFFAAAFSCTSKTEVKTSSEAKAVNKDSIKTVIATMEENYGKAMESRNIDAIMPYYADDVKSFDAGNEPVVGAPAVKKMMSDMMAKLPQGMTIKMVTDDIIVSGDGSLVSENGHYIASDSAGTKMNSGYFLATFELRDGAYKCVREMVAADKKTETK
jgi:ketosteroid isomerase-like protein